MAHGVYRGPEGGPPSLGNILGARPCGMSTKWPKRHTAGSGLAQEEPRVVNPGRKAVHSTQAECGECSGLQSVRQGAGGGGRAGAGSCPLHLQWVGEPWMTPSTTAGRRARPVHKSRGVCGSASYTPAVANSLTQENMALTAPDCSDPWRLVGGSGTRLVVVWCWVHRSKAEPGRGRPHPLMLH